MQDALVEHIRTLGGESITGKPYKPTTQGKNERFHQTLFRYLDSQPLAKDLKELQAQVDSFDHLYNTERPIRACPGASPGPGKAGHSPVAAPPRPDPACDEPVIPGGSPDPSAAAEQQALDNHEVLPTRGAAVSPGSASRRAGQDDRIQRHRHDR